MQENIYFSIVVPSTFNRSSDLLLTINSVLCQDYHNFELLIIDDSSYDDTPLVVKKLNDPRIKYDWMENSGGPAAPRNRGIDISSGKWICFLDAGDTWFPKKLSVVKTQY